MMETTSAGAVFIDLIIEENDSTGLSE